MKAMNIKKSAGFTLIELVMVIVILGILAAFALPRFADLGSDAREATIKGAAGAVRSAAAIAHSRWLADGSPQGTDDGAGGTTPATIELDGASGITMSDEGYPTADTDGIGGAAQLSNEFSVGSTIALKDQNDAVITGCSFTYDPTDGTVTIPTDLSSC